MRPVSPPVAVAPLAEGGEGAGGGGLGRGNAIERTVAGLGYDLVQVEHAARGLLRVTIDRIPGHSYPLAYGAGEFVTVDDCEAVTRQLQYVLEVEGVDYARLEVSSPGLDRLLVRPEHFRRFAGERIELALRLPFEGRRHWRGRLVVTPAEGAEGASADSSAAESFAIQLEDDRAGEELAFELAELKEARLVPVIDFKGRGAAKAARQAEASEGPLAPTSAQAAPAAHDMERSRKA